MKNIISTESLDLPFIQQIVAGQEADVPPSARRRLMALLFLAPSTRTRLSMIRACEDIGVKSVVLDTSDLRLKDGESIGDTARALSSYVDGVGIRVHGAFAGSAFPRGHQLFCEFLAGANVPVLNLECDTYHPCQALADAKTLVETFPDIGRRKVVMSWAYAARDHRVPAIPIENCLLFTRLGWNVVLTHPPGYELPEDVISKAASYARASGGTFEQTTDRTKAYQDADVIYARNWMPLHGNSTLGPSEAKKWTLESDVLRQMSADNCRYMHCLPVTRGEEAHSEVIDGSTSLIMQQMKNRVPVQSLLTSYLLG